MQASEWLAHARHHDPPGTPVDLIPEFARESVPAMARLFKTGVDHRVAPTTEDNMIALLIIWVSGSVVLCLAFLAAAARRVPRMDEAVVTGSQGAAGQQGGLAGGKTTGCVPLSSYGLPVLSAEKH